MKQPRKGPNHLRLIINEERLPEPHPQSLRVTDEELRAKAARAALHLVEDSEAGLGLDDKREIDVGPPIIRARYGRIFKPKPKAE